MSVRLRRGLALGAAGVLAVVVVGVLALHSPWTRSRALSWAQATLASRYDLVLTARDLSYNAVTRRASASDVSLAARGHEDAPFFSASHVAVRLPWSVYGGRFAIDHLEVDGGAVTIERDANGVSNLPAGAEAPALQQPRRLDLRGLQLRGFSVRHADRQHDVDLSVPGIEVSLARAASGASGSLAIRGATTLRVAERTLRLAPTDTDLEFDGSSVSLADLHIAADEADLTLSGRIDRVLDEATFNLSLAGAVNVARAAEWAPLPVPVGGAARIAGGITGPVDDFTATLQVTSNTLVVGREQGLTGGGALRVTLDAATSDAFTIAPATGGEIRASFLLPFGDAPAAAKAQWRGVDITSAFRLGDLDALPLAAALAGTATFTGGEPSRLDVDNRATATPVRGRTSLSGTLTASLVGGRLEVQQRHRTGGLDVEGPVTVTVGDTTAASPLGGRLQAHVLDVATALRSLAPLGASVPESVAGTSGEAESTIVLSGSVASPVFSAEVRTEGVHVADVGRVSGTLHAEVTPALVTVSAIALEKGAARVTGGVEANLRSRALTGALRLDAPRADDLQEAVPADWRIGGPVRGTATLTGTIDQFRMDAALTGSALTWMGESIDTLDAAAIVTADAVELTRVRMTREAGRLTGKLRYAIETGAYTASLEGRDLPWKTTLFTEYDTAAIVALTFEGHGTLERPEGRGRVDFTLSNAAAGSLLGQGDITVDLLGDHARLQARMPSLGALVNGTLSTSEPYAYRGVAVLNKVNVAPLATLAGALAGEVTGTVSLSATASGTLRGDEAPVAFANIQAVDANVGGVLITLATPSRMAWQAQQLTVDEVDLAVGAGRLRASGTWSERTDARFEGTYTGEADEALLMARAFGVPASIDATGAVTMAFRSMGPGRTSSTLTVRNGTLANTGQAPTLTGLQADATLDGDALTVSRLSGALAAEKAAGTFSLSATATVPSFDLAAIDGALTLDSASFTAAGVPVAPQRPSRLTLRQGRLTLDDVAWTAAGAPVEMSGGINLAEGDPSLDLVMKGLADLRVLSAFMPTIGFNGSAALDARITGTLSAPLLGGRITIEGGEIAIASPRFVLSDVAGTIVLDGQTIRLDHVTGTANGGAATIDGSLQIVGQTLAGGTITAQAIGMALEFPEGLRTEADALLTFRLDPKAPVLTGDILVHRGSYTDTITLAGLARRSRAAARRVEPSYLDTVRLNLSVTTVDDLVVDNNYGHFDGGAELRVLGTVAEPGMTGRVTLREGGQIFLAGRTFRLTRGDISFTNLQRIDPEFNIEAEARVGGDDVKLTVSGTLEDATVDLTSTTGSKTPAELAAAIVGGGSTGEGALTLLSADLLGVTGRALGFDTLRVDRGDLGDSTFREDASLIADKEDPATRLTLAKRISSQVEVTLSQNLRESGKTTVIVSYFPVPSLELRALSRDNASLGVGVRHQVTFGGGATAVSRTAAPAREKVSAVTLAASSPSLEAELTRRLKLATGKTFDFIDWQGDVDRLRAEMRARGFFEARVRARRIDGAPGEVALEYGIEPGPATTLEVRGVELPPADRAAIEEAWSRSVFDGFLVEEIRELVQRHLVTVNTVGAAVDVVIERPSPEAKRASVTVSGGQRLAGREIRFEGQSALSASRLLNAVMAAGVEVEGWVKPASLARAVKAAYADAGYLAARVTVGAVRVDGQTAVLPVTIVEWLQARVTSVTWEGVAPSRRAGIEAAADLELPAAYTSATVSAVRRRVTAPYREQGFTTVEVDVVPRIDETGTAVTLEVSVVEGPQSVLTEVVTSGLNRTSPDVVSGALRLPIGKPVNLTDWAQARKRLYDTNVFQQVDLLPVAAGEMTDGVQPTRAQVSVREFPAWRLRYGLQVEGDRIESLGELTQEQNLGVVAELRNQNLFGRALTLGLFGQYEYDAQDATAVLSTGRLFGWRARTNLFTFFNRDRLRTDAGDLLALTDRAGVSLEQRWRRRTFELVYGYRFERNHTYDPEPSPLDPFPLDFSAKIGRISTAVLLDRRDDPLNSRRGTFSSVSWDQAASAFGSDLRNAKLLAQQFVFAPVGPVVLASRAQYGGAYGPDDLLPNDRFRAGGATTVRGYGEDGLGPLDYFGLPAGGEMLLVFNQEARVPLFWWFGAVGFVDAGGVFSEREEFQVKDLKVGYGVGLRVNSPIGMLRVDFGIPASTLPTSTRTPNTVKSGRWYVGIGHIF